MKKQLTMALAAAMVMGASTQAFAAQNPFSDVPADHWAYDAVAELAKDGVIEGYGDATFQGSKNITRYEMAQMVAKAMSKSDVSATDKAMIDKLAAEFSDELDNLGVRVAALERNADKVQWHGMLRYDYESVRYDRAPINLSHWAHSYAQTGDKKVKHNEDLAIFRLEPKAEVNDHWTVNARLDANHEMNTDSGYKNLGNGNLSLKRIWAQGKYGNTTVKFGRFGVGIDMDIMFDTQFSGAQVAFGNPHGLRTTINAGRFSLNNGNQYSFYAQGLAGDKNDKSANYQAIGLLYSGHGWTNVGLAYHHLNSDTFGFYPGYVKDAYYSTNHPDKIDEDEMNTLTSKATYHFDKNWALQYNYGHNFSADNYNDTFCYGIGYKEFENFNSANAGQWGASVMYRYVGQNVGPTPTYTMDAGTKGVAFSIIGNPMAHTYVWLNYELGKDLITNHNYDEIFCRLEYNF